MSVMLVTGGAWGGELEREARSGTGQTGSSDMSIRSMVTEIMDYNTVI